MSSHQRTVRRGACFTRTASWPCSTSMATALGGSGRTSPSRTDQSPTHGNVATVRRLGVLVAALLLFILSACSDDYPRPSPGPEPSSATGRLGEACDRLVGRENLVQQTLDLADGEPLNGQGVQGKLFEIVADGPEELSDPVGVLVDFLDDQSAYLDDGEPNKKVTDAVARIKQICA